MDDNTSEEIRIYRILIIAYDVNEPEKWECGRRIMDFAEKLRSYKGDDIKFEVHLVGHQPNPDEITGMTVPETFDLMIGQQFSCEHVQKMAYKFNTPYAILLNYNTGEYTSVIPRDNIKPSNKKPDLVLCWNEGLVHELKSIDPYIETLSINGNDEKWLQSDSKWWELVKYRTSILVPCHGHHVHGLDKLLDNFCSFTKRPNEVIISVSLDDTQNMKEISPIIYDLMEKYLPKINVDIILSGKARKTAENLNIALEASTGNIINAGGADELFHPQFIEIAIEAWKKYKPVELHVQIVGKDVFETDKEKRFNIDEITLIPGHQVKEYNHPGGSRQVDRHWQGWRYVPTVAMGISFVDRDILMSRSPNQNNNKVYRWPKIIQGEDTVMHKEICWDYPDRSIWLLCPLIYYGK